MRKFFPAVFLLLLSAAAPGYGQTDAFLQTYQENLVKNPPDLTFELRLKDDKTQFQPGEIIDLELIFSSTSPDKYTFNNRSYDRGGRLEMDDFVLDRIADIADPLDDYFHKAMLGRMMGGLFSISKLGSKPVIVNYQLNEWMRFEKSGKYRLYISSPRVTFGKSFGEEVKYVSAASNTVEFEILPADKSWQQQKLAEAVKTLDSVVSDKERGQACETLRYLGTEGAAAEMIKRFKENATDDSNCGFDIYMGLQGSSQRKFIVGEMERTLKEPDFPVSTSFLQNLSLLAFFLHNPQPFSPYPGNKDEATLERWEMEMAKIREQRADELKKYTALLESAIQNKKEKALPASVYTLFSFRDSKNSSDAVDTLINIFLDLAKDKQKNLLEYYWEQFNTEKMLPNLRKIYAQYDTRARIEPWSDPLDIVLKRIYELAPREGRDLILAEMRRPEIRVSNDTLLILPENEIPELEDILLKKATYFGGDFEERRKALLILERYGTAKALMPLQTAYRDRIGETECAVQQNLINYFLKHDPEFGAKTVEKAMAARGRTKCYNSVFQEFPAKYWSPAIEAIAVSYLDDENIGLVKEMAEILGKLGSADVKEKLWQRFEKFSAALQKDPAANTKTFGDYPYPVRTIESSFINALTNSPNWKLSEAELKKLSQLCITQSCKAEVEISRWKNDPVAFRHRHFRSPQYLAIQPFFPGINPSCSTERLTSKTGSDPPKLK